MEIDGVGNIAHEILSQVQYEQAGFSGLTFVLHLEVLAKF